MIESIRIKSGLKKWKHTKIHQLIIVFIKKWV
jgi:hypothetical protein